MAHRKFVDIYRPNRHLSVSRGFMIVSGENKEEIGRVALDDLEGVIISGYGCTHSSNLISALSTRGVPISICDKNFNPSVLVLPLVGNFAQSERMRLQAEATVPMKKNLWKQVVKAKIEAQQKVLDCFGQDSSYLRALAGKVASGDKGNKEAQAARYYWPKLMGASFRRVVDDAGINSMLNYGYAILRSCVSRAVVASGLHPTLGFHHIGPTNPMCLVDDLMEPLRPLCDFLVKKLHDQGYHEVGREVKKQLANIPVLDISEQLFTTTVFSALGKMATSLVGVYEKKPHKLDIPKLPSLEKIEFK